MSFAPDFRWFSGHGLRLFIFPLFDLPRWWKENGFAVLASAFSLERFCEWSPAVRADVVFLAFAFNFLLQTNLGLAAQVTNNH